MASILYEIHINYETEHNLSERYLLTLAAPRVLGVDAVGFATNSLFYKRMFHFIVCSSTFSILTTSHHVETMSRCKQCENLSPNQQIDRRRQMFKSRQYIECRLTDVTIGIGHRYMLFFCLTFCSRACALQS